MEDAVLHGPSWPNALLFEAMPSVGGFAIEQQLPARSPFRRGESVVGLKEEIGGQGCEYA